MEDETLGRELILLVVEDDLDLLNSLRDILEAAGFQVQTATHGEQALESFREKKPDLIISDISMPIIDGLQLFEAVRGQSGGLTIPFIFLTTHSNGKREDKFQGRSLGADDYITKPISSNELLTAVRSRLCRTDEQMAEQLKEAYINSLRAFANAIGLRDKSTHAHVLRVNAYAQAMAKELGWSEPRLEALEYGAILHDIGKLDIRRSILTKKEPLSAEEWKEMRRHTEYGAFMIKNIDHLAPALPIVLYHHEAWDGSGYPEGLEGDEIPEEARLLAVVNAFDIMTSDQPYRSAIAANDAFMDIVKNSGSQFDPNMVEAFRRCWDRGDIQAILKGSQ